ncbi:MAG: type I restriction endonuclease subunit R [Ignavibacteriae bacterium]|nr:MAG: type I restriction endonuclease subunit R [Ignavibacteriota bacterium]
MKIISESHIEEAALDILKELGYEIIFGPDLLPDGLFAERKSYDEVVLSDRFKNNLYRINKNLPKEALEEAAKKVLRISSPELITNNEEFHKLFVNGVDIEYRKPDGTITGDKAWLFDFEDIDNNEFLAVNQFTVIENGINRRPDIVIFVNGLPLAVIELKNIADANATIWSAFNQIETYKDQIKSLFAYNEICIISDGIEARAGTISSDRERFQPWKTIDGEKLESDFRPQLDVLLRGMLNKKVLFDLIRHFIVFENDNGKVIKKISAYHQYHAVNKALETTIKATRPDGDRRAGVIWHTQGSGKSLSMVFYTGKLVLTLDNPTIVVLTDRNDLDNQLFDTFGRCMQLLRQTPVQAESREHLKELLRVASGGVVFTTIHKFFPENRGEQYPLLSDRSNIVVIADEAHRSQYDFIDGYARHMRDALPCASFIGFTGTPIEKSDANTVAVFGDYIDIYDIEQSVKDGATVPIYYESRLAKLELKESERPKIDPDFEEATENEEVERKDKLKSKWARMEAIVGSEKRIKTVAKDIVEHFEKRIGVLEGKGMIVCMSRRICIELYKEIKILKPEWHNDDDEKGFMKVIMTGSADDPADWQQYFKTKDRRKRLAELYKDPKQEFKLAIVRDMWLTGFDAPSMHTMYIDKPMRGHGLMQTIARVNRVYKDKPGGLIVDYLGIAYDLKKALSQYTESGGKGKPAFEQSEAIAVMIEKYEIVCGLLKGYDYKKFFTANPQVRMAMLPDAMEYIFKLKDGKDRFLKHVTELSHAFALSVPSDEALKISDEVGFFQALKAVITKHTVSGGKPIDDLDTAIKQIISKAIASDKVIDIFKAVGLKKPDLSILSDEFLAEVKAIPQQNLAFELLKKLLNDEIKIRTKKNLVRKKSFLEMLESAIRKYQNKTIETAQVIEELISLAKNLNEEKNRGIELKLSDDEIAFFDALEVNDSAVQVMGDEALKTIAREVANTIRKNISIDWDKKATVQAKLRVLVKRILRKYGYPPDKTLKATQTVLEQAEIICREWPAEELLMTGTD